MCELTLTDRKHSEYFFSLLGIQSGADVFRHGRLRWFGHLERKTEYDWVSVCKNMEVAGKCRVRGRKTLEVCVSKGLKLHGLQPEWVINIQGSIKGLYMGQMCYLRLAWKNECCQNKW